MKKIILSFCLILLVITNAYAASISLKPNHPTRYVVKSGDTLWDIAAKFLRNPSDWPRLWHANPHVKEPDAIYPGDVLVLSTQNGQPVLQRVSRGPVTYTHPHPIATIPYRDIAPFLQGVQVLQQPDLNNAAYVVSLEDGRTAAGDTTHLYARDLHWGLYPTYSVFSLGETLVDPQTGRELGIATVDTGVAHLVKLGNPSVLYLTKTFKEVMPRDHILPLPKPLSASNFVLHPPVCPIDGEVISLLDDACAASQYQIVIIDRGAVDRLHRGDVLGVYRRGDAVLDPMKVKYPHINFHLALHHDAVVKLPDERVATVVIFRVFPETSYGLVLAARKEVERGDRVLSPM